MILTFWDLLHLARQMKRNGLDHTQRRQGLEAAFAYFRFTAFKERRA